VNFNELQQIYDQYKKITLEAINDKYQSIKQGFDDSFKLQDTILKNFIKNPNSNSYSDVVNKITGPNSAKSSELVGEKASKNIKKLLDKMDEILGV
jgi:hypothetical protein